MKYYKEPIIWIDEDHKELKSSDISDGRFKKILYDVHNGKGWPEFVNSNTLAALFKEAYRREILRADILLLLNRWAEFWRDVNSEQPSREVTEEFEIV